MKSLGNFHISVNCLRERFDRNPRRGIEAFTKAVIEESPLSGYDFIASPRAAEPFLRAETLQGILCEIIQRDTRAAHC